MNTPVSFNTAKLLKEKGFNNECSFFYSVMEGEQGKLLPVTSSLEHIMEYSIKGHKFFDESTDRTLIHHTLRNDYAKGTVTAPTIAEVVMWVYEKHNIWIFILYEMGSFCYVVDDTTQDDALEEDCRVANKGGYKTPTKAYSSAIEHTLNNLI